MHERYPVMLDGVSYDHKPEGGEIGAITRRLQRRGSCMVTAEELATAIRDGHTWMAGTFGPSERGWGPFLGLRLWALDIDNHMGKRQLVPHDAGFAWPKTIRQRLVSLGFEPILCHSTAHATREAVRFRTVLDVGEIVTDETEAKELIQLLLTHFPECDQSCKNPNRLSFGAQGCGMYKYFVGTDAWPS